MPRQKAIDPRVEVSVSLPESLVVQLDFLQWDILRGRVQYGARSQLIEAFLRQYVHFNMPAGDAIVSTQPLPDLSSMSDNDIAAYINDVRRRVLQDNDAVSDEEINHALKALAQSRTNAGKRQATKAATKAAPSTPSFGDLLAGLATKPQEPSA